MIPTVGWTTMAMITAAALMMAKRNPKSSGYDCSRRYGMMAPSSPPQMIEIPNQ